jgi:hypothetical protein
MAPDTRRRPSVRLLILLLLTACKSSTTVVETPVATTLTITQDVITLTFLSESTPLLVEVKDQNGAVMQATVTFASADAAVATVSATGSVQAVANGSTTVTATSGALSDVVTVNVAQAAAGIFVVSGNQQEAIRDSTLADPVVARVQDLGGAGVDGVTVTFAPDAGDGTVAATTVVTNSNGEAQTSWTLGSSYGPKRLQASIPGASVQFTATARAEVPTPDLATVVPLTVVRTDPTSLESFVASTTIRNDGDLASGTSRVALMAGASEIGTLNLPSLAPNAQQVVQFNVSPLAAAQYAMKIVADADDAIVELNEENNEATRTVDVIQQTSVSTGTTSGLAAAADKELLFRFDVPAGPPTTLTIAVTGSNGDIDLYGQGGTRPSSRDDYNECVSAGPTSNESCQIVLASGTYHIILHAWTDFSGGGGPFSNASLTITLGGTPVPYNIDLVFVDSGTVTQNQAFRNAATQLTQMIIGDLPDHDFGTANPFPADQCTDGQPAVTGVVDDLRIYVRIIPIDGPLGTLAQAGPCAIRPQSSLPILGSMSFDEDDLTRLDADGDMYKVVLHEMAHVLGVGTIWNLKGLLINPSQPNNQGADTHFPGARAIAAFDAAGGTTFTAGSKVPVENMAGPGSGDGHWRETVMGRELMTPFLNSLQSNPFSAITVESLADLGYGVDPSKAETYSLPGSIPAQVGAPGQAVAPERVIDLSGDHRTGPIVVVPDQRQAKTRKEIRR